MRIQRFLSALVRSRNINTDAARRETVLNTLLLSWSVLALTALLIVAINSLRLGDEFDGGSPIIMAGILVTFLTLYWLSKHGLARIAAWVFVGILFVITMSLSIAWGILLPQALMMYVLVIVMAGILISSLASLLVTLGIGIFLMVLAWLQSVGHLTYDSHWQAEIPGVATSFTIAASMGVIAITAWLSNREIERSLRRAEASEAALKEERDLLEVKVEERTQKLQESQIEKLSQMYRFAEFGRSASGYFHDLANHLTTVMFNLERLDRSNTPIDEGHMLRELQKTEHGVKQALEDARRAQKFMLNVQKNLMKQEVKLSFWVIDEVHHALDVLEYRAKKRQVAIRINRIDKIKLFGNPLKFSQIVTNLVSNAIDAYPPQSEDDVKSKREILISILADSGKAVISVRDWGVGIPEKNLQKIFEPLFTTKSVAHGTGLGLSTAKQIVEKDFGGSISVESTEGQGAAFTVRLAITEEPSRTSAHGDT